MPPANNMEKLKRPPHDEQPDGTSPENADTALEELTARLSSIASSDGTVAVTQTRNP